MMGGVWGTYRLAAMNRLDQTLSAIHTFLIGPFIETTMVERPKYRALTTKQERKLVDFLDAEFLNMARGYKKRYA